jgi:hypothetical protein
MYGVHWVSLPEYLPAVAQALEGSSLVGSGARHSSPELEV